MEYFDKKVWDQYISEKDWYLKLVEEFKRLEKLKNTLNEIDQEKLKEAAEHYIEENLENNVIPLNNNGPNWDDERKPIDTIVIHHTTQDKPITNTRLNAKHLLRLYMPFFQNPNEENLEVKKFPVNK